MTRNARERVYCRHGCDRSQQVVDITSQRRLTRYFRKEDREIDVPDWVREVSGRLICGHPFTAAITLNTLVVIREAMAWERPQ